MKRKIRSLGMKLDIAGDLIIFLWQRKLWWIIPPIMLLLLLGLFIVLTEGSVLAPFIYTLF